MINPDRLFNRIKMAIIARLGWQWFDLHQVKCSTWVCWQGQNCGHSAYQCIGPYFSISAELFNLILVLGPILFCFLLIGLTITILCFCRRCC